MVRDAHTAPPPLPGSGAETDTAWLIALAAARRAARTFDGHEHARYALGDDAQLHRSGADAAEAVIAWHPGDGWRALLADEDPGRALLDLYLPICSATAAQPITVGHLGVSLDGFIATHTGESQFVTGHQNILHLHRMRALCDAVIVGAGTVAADDPQLTTRLVPGPNPLRVVFDPARRLTDAYRIFNDDSVETWYFCARSLVAPGETHVGAARLVGVDDEQPGAGVGDVVRLLRSHGCARVFVEGGGVTVSAFLETGLLDRLQIAIAPLIIGDGRPAIRVPARANLSDCRRPQSRVFRMGGDVLFDCDLKHEEPDVDPNAHSESARVTRII